MGFLASWLYFLAGFIACPLVFVAYERYSILRYGFAMNPNYTSRETQTESESEADHSSPQRQEPLPDITAGLENAFRDVNNLHLSRVPHGAKGTSSQPTLLSVIHPRLVVRPSTEERATKPNVDTSRLHPSDPVTSTNQKKNTRISRATLMSLLALTNARPIFTYSSASGHRSAYPSYCGQWTITWPIGKPCIVSLAAHDSHSSATDVYPPSFPARVDKCVEMLAGIVADGEAGWKLAFPGRAKGRGPWVLKERKKGLAGAHGQRHLWNIVGGKVWEVDLLVLEEWKMHDEGKLREIEVPCLAGDAQDAVVHVLEREQMLLAKALDRLPWTSLSWSMHRGMRDVLLAWGKPVMDRYRAYLAVTLKLGVKKVHSALVERGWDADFVRSSMGALAESSILAGSGNSGDLVRIVAAIVKCLLEADEAGASVDKDATSFWMRAMGPEDVELDMDSIVALAKFFVLEWSQELDYQLYHELPVELYLA